MKVGNEVPKLTTWTVEVGAFHRRGEFIKKKEWPIGFKAVWWHERMQMMILTAVVCMMENDSSHQTRPRLLLATGKPIDALYFSVLKSEFTHLRAISKSSQKFFNINSPLSSKPLQISQDLPNNRCIAVKQIMVKDHKLKETYCTEHHRTLEKPFCYRGVSRIDRKSK